MTSVKDGKRFEFAIVSSENRQSCLIESLGPNLQIVMTLKVR